MSFVVNSPLFTHPITFPLAEILYNGHVVIHRIGTCFLISAVGGPFNVRLGGPLSVLNGSVQISTATQAAVTLVQGSSSSAFLDPQVDATIVTEGSFCQILVWAGPIPGDGSPLTEGPVDPSKQKPPVSSR